MAGEPVRLADAKVGDTVIRTYRAGASESAPAVYERRRVARATKKRLEVVGLGDMQFERANGLPVGRLRSRLLDPTPEIVAELARYEAAEAAKRAARDRDVRERDAADRAAALKAVAWIRSADADEVVRRLGADTLRDLWHQVRPDDPDAK